MLINNENVKVLTIKTLTNRQQLISNSFVEKGIPYSFEYEDYVSIKNSNKNITIETPNFTFPFNIDIFKKVATRDYIGMGELCITATHFDIFAKLLKSPYDFFVIFEDDAKPIINAVSLDALIQEWMTTNSDIFYMQSQCPWSKTKKTFICGEQVSPHLVSINETMDFSGSSAYAINKKGAQKILSFVEKYGMINIIDSMMKVMILHNNINVVTSLNYQNLFDLEDSTSTHREYGFSIKIS